MKATDLQTSLKASIGKHFDKEANSAMWAWCQSTCSEINAEAKTLVKLAVGEAKAEIRAELTTVKSTDGAREPLTDEERKLKLVLKLDDMLDDPKSTAADIKEFRDYFGLGGKKSDTFIEIIDFKDAYPEESYVIELTAALIQKKIEEANGGADA